MAALKMLRPSTSLTWDYDDEADVLYLAVGEPRAADGVDIGDGLVLRYDEDQDEIVGLTVIGLRQRLREALDGTP